MTSNDVLKAAIDDLYRVFATYRRPTWFEGCACCWGSGEPIEGGGIHGRIRVTAPGGDRPVNELGTDELAEVADQLPHLGGGVDVLRHYLPRVYEILVTTGFDWPDFEPVLARLNFGANLGSTPWSRWPNEEQRAITKFFEVLWKVRLQTPTEAFPFPFVDTLLCGFGLAVNDITPYLTKWLAFDEPYSARHLLQLLQSNDDLARGRLSNAFWTSRPPYVAANLRSVVRFLHAETTALATLSALGHIENVDERTALEECFSLLPGNDGFAANELEKAVEANDLPVVDALLSQGANAHAIDLVTGVPLWQFAYHCGAFEMVSKLAASGADLNYTDDDGKTLLHWLVGQDPSRADVERLLRLGASFRVADRNGWTPLHTASQYGFVSSVVALLKGGADPLEASNGTSALDVAVMNKRVEVEALLRSKVRN